MPSIINSDDGVVSGSSGLKTTGGNDGILNLQSNGATIAALSGGAFQVGGNNISAQNSMGFRNRIINGDMRIDQRNAGASVNPSAASVVYTLDRWAAFQAQASKFTVQQNAGSVTPPSGFTNYLGVTSSAATTPAAGESYILIHNIEGFNTADLGWGTANAQTITLSFVVRSSLTGTFGGVVKNSATNRSYPFTFAIASANTWESKTVTIVGDTSGTWLANNGVGIQLLFGLGVGSTFSGTAGAWSGSNFNSATGAVSVVGTNGATFYITGVQLEAGSVATPFERRPYGTELALCQRYFQTYNGNTAGPNLNDGSLINLPNWSTTEAIGAFVFPTMRASPTLSFNALSGFRYLTAGSVFTPGNIALNGANVNRLEIYVTPSSGSWTSGNCGFFRIHTAADFLRLSAEL
jgi:hypothetical protein